ncbi:hypothetical protein [Sinomicrobium weinanense]|uniref:Uncharacterized protein n=1 Tax=Sinomicrobium weinanense TaxID=2842200 RepID=A0A926JPW7_9FLAO|nr:hypothetical protein [Sinomicrobium weinanense]MBC9795149.1 hypothetical protein [Sinomicrobium weinanense]MBU3121926.1 hypothetical protein [Sinomicrobium weinanense]
MRKIFWIFPLVLLSCKTKQTVGKPPVEIVKNIPACALTALEKTMDYNNELKKFTVFHKDTVIEIEKKLIGTTLFTSILDLKASSQYLWLIRKDKAAQETDSILIHCIGQDPTLSVESEFRTDSCEILKTEAIFHENGDPKEMTTRSVKL